MKHRGGFKILWSVEVSGERSDDNMERTAIQLKRGIAVGRRPRVSSATCRPCPTRAPGPDATFGPEGESFRGPEQSIKPSVELFRVDVHRRNTSALAIVGQLDHVPASAEAFVFGVSTNLAEILACSSLPRVHFARHEESLARPGELLPCFRDRKVRIWLTGQMLSIWQKWPLNGVFMKTSLGEHGCTNLREFRAEVEKRHKTNFVGQVVEILSATFAPIVPASISAGDAFSRPYLAWMAGRTYPSGHVLPFWHFPFMRSGVRKSREGFTAVPASL